LSAHPDGVGAPRLAAPGASAAVFATTIFVSSFLLFLVQPLIARLILPWFGGSASVWTTCMLFFQSLLLAGYAYAHLVTTRLPLRSQVVLHTLLLAAAVAMLPIAPDPGWKPGGEENPTLRILLLLTASVGLPYFLLATTSPLLQAWFARTRPGEDPYRLFAISNLASLAALVGYPFLVEPRFASGEQVVLWSWLFGAFAVLCAVLAWRTPGGAPGHAGGQAVSSPVPGPRDYLLWLALSATGSVLLLTVTNHLTQNVASIPLLWLAPLTLYLASFILTFEGRHLYRPKWLWAVVLVAAGAMAWLAVDPDFRFDLVLHLAIFLPGMFIGCMFCHGELYRHRSAPQHLTAFYLTISAGGALGGLLVAVVAPLVFNAYYELGLALIVLALLAAILFRSLNRTARYASLAVLLGTTGCAVYDGMNYHDQVRYVSRSFFGVLRVKEYGEAGTESHLRRLLHGVIMHGEQYLHPNFRTLATSYYRPESGVGVAIASQRLKTSLRVGVVGLGVGTLAVYGRKGDLFHFYDIDPRVVSLARSEFTYLSDSAAEIVISMGDARLSLEREEPHGYDVLAVDAFSSDAIPVHLITREALETYLRHMKPDGIVAFHVSNRFLDLVPVVGRLARETGAHAVVVRDRPKEDSVFSQSDWVLVSRDPDALARAAIKDSGAEPIEDIAAWRTWTDDYSNLVQILK